MLIPVSLFSQVPEEFNYQAVVRDDNGIILKDQNIGLQFIILQDNNSVYEETHNTTTNSFGLVNLGIGSGTVISGDFSTIDWGAGIFNIQVGLDPAGGTNYSSIIGMSTLKSVPYALYAKNVDKPSLPASPFNSFPCTNGLAINLVEVNPTQDADGDGDLDSGAAILYASDFLPRMMEDGVSYSINRAGDTPDPNQEMIVLTCDDNATLIIEIWQNDLNGNPLSFCETYVLVQDNNGVCVP